MLALSIAAAMCTCCSGAEVVVRNHSTAQLREVTVSAKTASRAIGSIDAGDSRRTSLCPKGEAADAELSFVVNGQRHREHAAVYFECDFLYRVQLDVAPDFTVDGTATLR